MVIDTSALLAILKAEPDATDLLDRLSQSGPKWISTATLLEIQIVVISQLGEAGPAELDLLLLSEAEITPLPFDTLHLRHRAGLNLGDCFSCTGVKTAA